LWSLRNGDKEESKSWCHLYLHLRKPSWSISFYRSLRAEPNELWKSLHPCRGRSVSRTPILEGEMCSCRRQNEQNARLFFSTKEENKTGLA
jgi:hypothetical protein